MNWSVASVVAGVHWGVVNWSGVVTVGWSYEGSELVEGKLSVVASDLSHVDLALAVVDSLPGVAEESDGVVSVHMSLVSAVLSVERLKSDGGSLSVGSLTVVRGGSHRGVGHVAGVVYWCMVYWSVVYWSMVYWSVVYWSVVGHVAAAGPHGGVVHWCGVGGVVHGGVVAGPDWSVVSRGVGLDVGLELCERDGARVVSVVLSEGGLEVRVRKVDVLAVEEPSELGSVHLVVAVGVSSSE